MRAIEVVCDKCGAKVEETCVVDTSLGYIGSFHKERVAKARTVELLANKARRDFAKKIGTPN